MITKNIQNVIQEGLTNGLINRGCGAQVLKVRFDELLNKSREWYERASICNQPKFNIWELRPGLPYTSCLSGASLVRVGSRPCQNVTNKKTRAQWNKVISLGNCDKLYFIFEFEYWMWVQILQKLEKSRIAIGHLLD